MFKVTFPDARYLLDLFKAINVVAEKICLRIGPDVMAAKAVDPSAIAMVDFSLARGAAEEWELDGHDGLKIAVSVSEMLKIIGGARGGETIIITYNPEEKRYRSLEERLRLYDEVMRLKGLGLGYKRIARIIEEMYGVRLNPGMICNWVRGRYHPLRKCNRLVEGPGLAYVIGGWLGDGSLSKGKNYKHCVALPVKDYDFAEEWGRRLADALGRSKPYVPRWDDELQRWVVKGFSILLYNLLKRAKEGDPSILMPYLEKYPAEACRGFFDAEGWVDDYGVLASNTDSRIINLFEELLRKLGVNCRTYLRRRDEFMTCPRTGKVYRRNSEFIMRLAIYGKENILRFAEKVGFTIARKRATLIKLVRRYRGC